MPEIIVNNSLNESRITLVAIIVTMLVALGLPVAYFSIAYQQKADELLKEAAIGAKIVAEVAGKQQTQLSGLVSGLNQSNFANSHKQFRLNSPNGEVLLANVTKQAPGPNIERQASITANTTDYGQYTAIDSYRPLLVNTGFIMVFSFALSGFIYWMFNIMPLHQIRVAQQKIKLTKEALIKEIEEKNRALKRVQYSGNAIRHLASHDLLTDLPNRTYLEGSLREAIAEYGRTGNPFSLILLDLNRFKDINDTLGHQSGDLVIREVARRLSSLVAKTCTLARLDGDEFALLNPHAKTTEDAISFANHILTKLEAPLALRGFSLDTAATLGIAMFPEHGDNPDILMQHADIAMYSAKKRGKDFVVFDDSMNSDHLTHLSLRGDLRTTIDTGEIEVFYQPKIDLINQTITGVEALARWRHPERGFISPAIFIPIAEQTGLIHPLTGLVLNVSLNQVAQWRYQQRNLGVAVNLSVRSLHDNKLAERIEVLLKTWNIPTHLVTLEVTESAIMAEPSRSLEILTDLSSMGIHISIDDFGTGYSSLSYIKRLPVQEIKIDRSFVMDMIRNENDNVIVRATIDMAHDLGLKVTAEGVEDQVTWERLQQYGCDSAQGFYMGKPLPANELNQWIVDSNWGLGNMIASAS